MIDKNQQPAIRRDLLSYQPICDTQLNIIGVEMVSRNLQTSIGNGFTLPAAQSVNAILNAFIYTGIDELFRDRLVFIKVAEEFLMSEMVRYIPKERIVLELAPCAEVSEALIEQFNQLADDGYALALDHWTIDDPRHPLLAHSAFARVRMDNQEHARLAIKQTAGYRVSILASRVNNEEDLALARELNATFLQGRFYQIRKHLANKKYSVAMQTIMELIAELNSDGSDLRLEKFYKENPELSLQLFHMVNSAGSGLSISTIRQAIFILGRSQMIRWLQTILYTFDDNVRPSALMQSALWRAKFMEVLSAYYKHKVSNTLEDMAFVTGIISLADALIGEPMEVIISKMKLSDTIQDALLYHKGPLGRMLSLTEALEAGDFVMAEDAANELELNSDLVMTCQNTALAWATKISCHQDA